MSAPTERQWHDRPQPEWKWCWAYGPPRMAYGSPRGAPQFWQRRPDLGEWFGPTGRVRDDEFGWYAGRGWQFTCADNDVPEPPR